MGNETDSHLKKKGLKHSTCCVEFSLRRRWDAKAVTPDPLDP